MSRIGSKPITIPQGVDVKIDSQIVEIKGKRGVMRRELHPRTTVSREGDELIVTPANPRADKALWGLSRSLLANMVTGVTEGFVKKMEIVGVGYRAAVKGKSLSLSLGLSHPVDFPIPDGIKISVEKNTQLTVEGNDSAVVGQVCADIRKYRPPEPYKGKGIRYAGEIILRKEGKKK